MKQVYLFLFLFPFLSPISYQDGVSIVFKNDTGRDFNLLTATIRGQKFIFKGLKQGQQTEPIKVAESYSYCYAQAISAKDTITCQPIDFVGETLYKSGSLKMIFFMFPGENNKKYMGIK